MIYIYTYYKSKDTGRPIPAALLQILIYPTTKNGNVYGVYSGCFMLKNDVIRNQMYDRKFCTKKYNSDIVVGKK